MSLHSIKHILYYFHTFYISSRSLGFNRDIVTETPFLSSADIWPWQLPDFCVHSQNANQSKKEATTTNSDLTAGVNAYKSNAYRAQAGAISEGSRQKTHAQSVGRVALQI